MFLSWVFVVEIGQMPLLLNSCYITEKCSPKLFNFQHLCMIFSFKWSCANDIVGHAMKYICKI